MQTSRTRNTSNRKPHVICIDLHFALKGPLLRVILYPHDRLGRSLFVDDIFFLCLRCKYPMKLSTKTSEWSSFCVSLCFIIPFNMEC